MVLKHVFVYGTLMSMFGNHRLIKASKNSKLIESDATTVDKYQMFSIGFPVVLTTKQETHIKGEVWAVDELTLTYLDRLENHPNWYVRTPILYTNSAGEVKEAEMYIMGDKKYAQMHLNEIKDGSYLNYMQNKKRI